jgi:hypothetical protein
MLRHPFRTGALCVNETCWLQGPQITCGITRAAIPQASVTQVPVAQAPVAQAPVAQAPVAQAPVAQAPVAQAPVAQAISDNRPQKHVEQHTGT